MAGESKGAFSSLSNAGTSPLLGALNSFRNEENTTPANKPKAYLNWILLDEQLQYVPAGSGADPIQDTGFIRPLTSGGPVNITKNGFLYIYVSNETQNRDVFFDNLSVQHITGPLTEETHYYPFGLTMMGISSKSLKSGYAENKKKYNGIEQNTDFDINMYDAIYRNLDPQIGRWWQVDPETENMEMWSPYVSNYNNPLLYSDPKGDFPILIPLIAYAITFGEVTVTTGLVVTTGVVAANAAEKHHNANAGTDVRGSYMSGSPLGVTTGDAHQQLYAKPAKIDLNKPITSDEKLTLYQPKDVVKSKSDGNVRNPHGARGKPDHQEKVKKLTEKAKSEAKEREQVLTEKKIQGHDSNRRPDVQIVDETGKTRKTLEAERKPNSQRNKKREEEYKKLNVETETHKVGN